MTPSPVLSLAVVQSLPKVELHAHFFGSIRRATLDTLRELGCQQRKQNNLPHKENAGADNLMNKPCIGIGDAFAYFSEVYRIVKSKNHIRLALHEVVKDFSSDNVVYLELRTTLKEIPEENVTAENYLELLVYELTHLQNLYPTTVRLILSLNRAHLTIENGKLEVEKVLSLAAKYPNWVVGIDIAGDPRKGCITSALRHLKSQLIDPSGNFHGKLKLTIHTAELEGLDGENDAILALKPHRIGHGCFLTKEQREDLKRERVTVEVCPTSNMCTLNITDLKHHHFAYYCDGLRQCSGVCVCTDDIGLFETSLSRELHLIATSFELTTSDILELQRSALRAAFCSRELKEKLEKKHFFL